jgi:aspartyl-tRNA(Asn)/glutamyl-tRNA(Gln) amidotransferase subunit B
MRGKEEAAAYRYVPAPDLRPLIVTQEMIDVAKIMPELPDAKVKRYVEELGIKVADAHVITSDKEKAYYFEEMLEQMPTDKKAVAKTAVTWLTSELLGRLNKANFSIENSPVDAKILGTLVAKIADSSISGKGGKDLLDHMMEHESRDVDALIEELGLAQVSDDGAILTIIDEILSANPEKIEQYKGGKEKLFGFFVGQTMKASKGSANPAKVNALLKERLG